MVAILLLNNFAVDKKVMKSLSEDVFDACFSLKETKSESQNTHYHVNSENSPPVTSQRV